METAIEEALDLFLDEAKAGATPEWLARQADASVQQVEAWRRKRGIADKASVAELTALRGLSASYEPSVHQVSSVDFETPQFVLREPLDYTAFSRACFALLEHMNTRTIASALGVQQRDVDTALVVWRRHLSTRGSRCLGCHTLVDARFGEFCSKGCHDRTTQR